MTDQLAHSLWWSLTALIILAMLVLTTNAQDDRMTVAECITRSGYTSEVYGAIADVSGVNAWVGDETPVMTSGERVSTFEILTNTGNRRASFLTLDGGLFLFVYMDVDEPGGLVRVHERLYAHHGACLLRID